MKEILTVTELNTKAGRWTIEEHRRFLGGLASYGRNWVKVAKTVGSRNSQQVRSHAQKFEQKNEPHLPVDICFSTKSAKATQYGEGVRFCSKELAILDLPFEFDSKYLLFNNDVI